MTHTRSTFLYAHISLFLIISSISVLPLFSQDITTSFATADLTRASRDVKISQEDHDKLMAEFQTLLETQAKKDDKKGSMPKIKPSSIVSFAIRFPAAYAYFRYGVPFIEDTLKNKALCEILKISFVTWLITEPIKDHAKPYYEYCRDKFDEFIDNFFLVNEEEAIEDDAEAAAA